MFFMPDVFFFPMCPDNSVSQKGVVETLFHIHTSVDVTYGVT